ncbi:MAG: coenzyme F420-0:L-glutamate ligase [Bdellovibrionales bacterium]
MKLTVQFVHGNLAAMERKPTVSVQALKTGIFHAGQDLFEFLGMSLKEVRLEGNILAITSKIVSLAENRIVAKEGVDKIALIKKEADKYLCEGALGFHLTIKHGLLIPSAGIDESNSETGGYILYPENPYASAQQIHQHLKSIYKLRQFGVILTDSHSMPLRRGVTGISLAHWGIRATESLAGQPDLFDRQLKYTHVDVVDSLAAMGVFVMGEADDCTPLAVISGATVEFTESTLENEIAIEPEVDLYFPLLAPHLGTNL